MDNFPLCEKIEPGDVIAVGDIHATWGPYRQFLDWVEGTGAVVIILGDMIDRGMEDIPVLEATRDRLVDPEVYGLQGFQAVMGNHERMFIQVVRQGPGPFRTATVDWLANGGNLKDFEAMEPHAEWIRDLPIFIRINDTLMLHAGLFPGFDPGETLKQGRAEDLLWMRNPFLKYGPEFDKWNTTLKRVVHGHTPVDVPDVRSDRVNIDTGACYDDGFLTAYNLTQNTFKFFK